jgi:DNA polymerase elongation subunit (family B)
LDESLPLRDVIDIELAYVDDVWIIVCIGFYCYSEDKYYEYYLPWNNKLPTLPPQGNLKLQEGIVIPYELFLFTSEKDLLEAFSTKTGILGPDIYTGWNIHFDLTQIFEAGERLHVSFQTLSPLGEVKLRTGFRGRKELFISGCSVFDLCEAAIDLLPPQEGGFTLRNVALKYLGFIKKDYRRRIQWLRETDPDELIRYNLGDVYSCVGLMKVEQLFHYYYERSVEAACNLEETYPVWKWLEHLLLKRSRLRLPTHLESEPKDIRGPRILETTPGIHDLIVCFDFKGLYLAIVKTWNMSPETRNEHGSLKVGNGSAYFSDPEGVWVDLVSFLEERKNLYDEQLTALNLPENEKKIHPLYHRRNGYKIASVATTGLFKWPGFRLFMPEILEDIYFIAREIVDYVVKKAQEAGWRIYYGDTDSAFIGVSSFDDIPFLLGYLNGWVSEFCKTKGIETHHFLIEEDYRFNVLFFDAGQKRYAGLTDKGELLVQGFEGKKINVSDIGRNIQKQLLRLILETRSESKAKAFVSEAVNKVKSGASLSELAFYHQFRKAELSEYKMKTSQLRGFDFSNFFRGSSEWPLLDWRDTHKYLPIRILRVEPSFEAALRSAQIDVTKTKTLAFDVDEDVEAFLEHIGKSGKISFLVDYDKITDLNVTRRVQHVVSALGWDFTGILPSKSKVGGRKVRVRVGQKSMGDWTK